MHTKTRFFANAALASAITLGLASQAAAQQDWDAINEETLRHFRALLQFDTSDPPGRELPAAEYIRDVLEAEGFEVEMLANNDERPNVVTRLKRQRQQRAAAYHGAYRHSECRSRQVDFPAV